tara:strand:- start:134 stop:1234 length:1101 start_codon:yes stop_codon:yes gene_type:complete
MSKAAELAKIGEVATNSQIGGRRNIIINGAMQVAQRGTSVTGIGAANGYFTVDRFKLFQAGTAGRLTMSQAAITDLGGFSNAMKFDVTTADASIAAGELFQIGTMFEGQDIQGFKKGHSDAEGFTVSFYVKGTAKTYSVELFDGDNTRHVTQTFNVTTSWNRIVLNFPADTTGKFDSDNALSLYILIWVHAGSTYTGGTAATSWAANNNANRAVGCGSLFSSTDNELFITGLQMEVGSQATPFEHRSFGEELALCQRYFTELSIPTNESFTHISTGIMGVYNSATQGLLRYFFPVQMRAVPTLSFDALSSFDIEPFDVAPSAIASGSGTTKALALEVTDPSSRTKGFAFMLTVDTATGYIRFDSEL